MSKKKCFAPSAAESFPVLQDDAQASGAEGMATDSGVAAAEAVPDGDLDVSECCNEGCALRLTRRCAVRRDEEEEEKGQEGGL